MIANKSHVFESLGSIKTTHTVIWFAASSGLGRCFIAAWGFCGIGPPPIMISQFPLTKFATRNENVVKSNIDRILQCVTVNVLSCGLS